MRENATFREKECNFLKSSSFKKGIAPTRNSAKNTSEKRYVLAWIKKINRISNRSHFLVKKPISRAPSKRETNTNPAFSR
jgi:hypothetical protein